jgi:dephospho-CoA kinase
LITIGLTGGIAAGKSLVAELLSRRGATVVDVDKLAHETYAPGTPGFRAVVDAFGADVVAPDGAIDRALLGRRVFSDATARRRLTDIVWPLTRQRIEAIESEHASAPGVLVFEAAVLVEAGWQDLFDQVWVVTAPPVVARERLIARNRLTPAEADARIAAQVTDEVRAAQADLVIDNSGDRQALEAQVDRAWAGLFARTA